MKLFIWEDVRVAEWTLGFVAVLAEGIDQARKIAIETIPDDHKSEMKYHKNLLSLEDYIDQTEPKVIESTGGYWMFCAM